jgi:hypothetical protein
MRRFPDKLSFEDAGMVNGSRIFKLTSRFRYFSTIGEIDVRAGTKTDGASIPRIFWAILSPFGDYFSSAVIHDFLYQGKYHQFTRLQSDQIFLEAMKYTGVPWYRRIVIYRHVRIFGYVHFKGVK